MKKKLAIVAVCVAVISIVIGTAGFNFTGIKSVAEDVEDTSSNLTYDITSISVFAFCVKDFFEGADEFGLRLIKFVNENGEPVSFLIEYTSFKEIHDGAATRLERIRIEEFPLSAEGDNMTEEQAQEALERIKYPIKPFVEWEKKQYTGTFSEIINALQFVSYVFGMIWGTLSLVLVVLIDTVVTAWELIRVAMRFMGLM